MCNRVAEVAGDAMLRYVSDKRDGVNTNRIYTSYNYDNHNYGYHSKSYYKNPADYINDRKLRKVRKKQY